MKLHTLSKITDRPKKRIGRGKSSGKGKTSGRGMNGQNARGKVRPGFEGGQMPLSRRLPHLRGLGFRARAPLYATVNVGRLEARYAEGESVTVASLIGKKLISGKMKQVKVLGAGDLTKKLSFRGRFTFSQKATDKIRATGATAV